ncbi:hydroxyacid dehydrogenase [candidate division KSB1 bacterium]|nr:hydroxyacid dehydrogenase [candidate division KSB1 bacterium]RQW10477.1 MAG: hydroxyacid dehydrogenase [candidate division KSB1 bacterium]
MKILIADKLSTLAVDALKKLGCSVTVDADITADLLPGRIEDYDILIVRSTKVTAATIEAAAALSLIIRAGAGVNTIDLEAASHRGIYVANCPGENTRAVVELVIGLMIAADRRLVDAAQDLRSGIWNKKEYGKAGGLAGRTLGIIGLGSIGTAVAQTARGLKMNVIAWSRRLTPEKAHDLDIGYCESPAVVAEKADVLSVHVAAAPETKHLCNAEFFSHMKEGAIFINTSRGDVVDTAALKLAMQQKKLRVALDVYENEPGSGKADFADVELAGKISGTPHIGASTEQASEAIAAAVVRIVEQYLHTGKPTNVVNIRQESYACATLEVTHYNKVGVLAAVLHEIRSAGINVEEMDNTIFTNGAAAGATIKIDEKPSPAIVEKIRQIEHVIRVAFK